MSTNWRAGSWLIADMCLHIVALVLVKSLGSGYPISQLVFVRALLGFVLLIPLVIRNRSIFGNIERRQLHLARIAFSAIALSCGYYAVSHLPLALFTALNYLRPAILMLMAVVILREHIGPGRWIAVAVGFVGVLVAVRPGELAFNAGIIAVFVAILAGCSATILLRRLKGAPELLMMVFYAGGIALLSAPLAFVQWRPVAETDVIVLLGIGVFSQCAQLCFLRAHWSGEVGFLGPLSYLSLLISATAGFLFFDEIPTPALAAGACIILLSAFLVNRNSRRQLPQV